MKLNSILLTTSALVFIASVSNAQSNVDWAGFYGGVEGSLFNGHYKETLSSSEYPLENTGVVAGGAFVGYNFAMNGILIGGEAAWSSANYSYPGSPEIHLNNLFDAKLKIGYPIGEWLGYAVLGSTAVEFVDPDYAADLTGATFGVGVSRKITDHLFVGAELLQRNLSGPIEPNGTGGKVPRSSTVDANFRTLSIRVGYEF